MRALACRLSQYPASPFSDRAHSSGLALDLSHVNRALATTARVLLLVKLNQIPAPQGIEVSVHQGGAMEEQIFSPLLGDKAKPTVGQPSDCTLSQRTILLRVPVAGGMPEA